MKAIMVNAPPSICEKVANGDCTILVKKSMPKIDTPFKCYIYCTQAKTIGDIILCKSEENTKLFGYNTVKGINKGFAENEDIKLKGKVIGEFVCDNIYPIKNQGSNFVVANEELCVTNVIARQSCLDYDDMVKYFGDKDGYAWHISNLVIYDEPKELSEFFTPIGKRPSYMLERPFSSWGYVEEKEDKDK